MSQSRCHEMIQHRVQNENSGKRMTLCLLYMKGLTVGCMESILSQLIKIHNELKHQCNAN